MVYDRLYGVDVSRQKTQQKPDMADSGSVDRSQENVLHSLAKKTPKEHKIGKRNYEPICATRHCNNLSLYN